MNREKFLSLKVVNEKGCWIWNGRTNGDKYGRLEYNKKCWLAHRLAYAIHKGEITEGLDVLHTCDTPLCVNPDHLFLGTHQDNMADRDEKGRQARGSKIWKAKLTEENVKFIRDSGLSYADLAAMFDVDQSQISRVKRRVTWGHV